MLCDHVIPKPPSVMGYACHTLVAGLTNGDKTLFCDMGDHLLIRTREPITSNGKPVPDIEFGEIRAFELRASCGTKVKGKHRYFPIKDWRARHQWLRVRAEKLGFEVLTVNSIAHRLKIEKDGKQFHMDQTDFTGILRVTDIAGFATAIEKGVGSVGKAFGHSMLIL